jgi:hypothetical protein
MRLVRVQTMADTVFGDATFGGRDMTRAERKTKRGDLTEPGAGRAAILKRWGKDDVSSAADIGGPALDAINAMIPPARNGKRLMDD